MNDVWMNEDGKNLTDATLEESNPQRRSFKATFCQEQVCSVTRGNERDIWPFE